MADFTLRDLHQNELSDLVGVERQMVDALPVMMAAVASEALREALSTHRERSRIHAQDFDCCAEPPWVETTVIDVIAVPGGK